MISKHNQFTAFTQWFFLQKKIPPTPLPLITAGFNKKILAPQRKTRIEAPGHITILQINLYLSTVTFNYSTIGNNVYQP